MQNHSHTLYTHTHTLTHTSEPLEPDVLAAVGPSGSQPAGGHMLLPMGLHQQDLSNLATVAAAAGTPLTAAISSTTIPVAPTEQQQPMPVHMYVWVIICEQPSLLSRLNAKC